jgi:hypothetical protein
MLKYAEAVKLGPGWLQRLVENGDGWNAACGERTMPLTMGLDRDGRGGRRTQLL